MTYNIFGKQQKNMDSIQEFQGILAVFSSVCVCVLHVFPYERSLFISSKTHFLQARHRNGTYVAVLTNVVAKNVENMAHIQNRRFTCTTQAC